MFKETERMIEQARNAQRVLQRVAYEPGATISISIVTDDNSDVAVANLYDLAAFVQALDNAFDTFISELS